MRRAQAAVKTKENDQKTAYMRLMASVLLLSAFLMVIGGFFAMAKAEEATPNMDPQLQAEASHFINDLADRALTILRNGELSNEDKISSFQDILQAGFDVPRISKIVLGRHVKKASKQQLEEYTAMFPEFMLKFYFSKLQTFDQQNIEVVSVIPQGQKDMYVRSRAIGKLENQPIAVDWRVRPQEDGSFKILDVKVEGISMARTQRDDFTARVNADGIEGLITYMKDIIEAEPDQESAKVPEKRTALAAIE